MAQNFAEAMQQGYDFGARQRQEREMRTRLAELESLAPQVIGGDVSASNRAFALDPQSAKAYQGEGDRQRKALYSLAQGYKSYIEKNPQGGQQYYERFLAPSLRGLGFGEPGPYNEQETLALADQVLAAYEGGSSSGNALSTYVDDQGRRVAVMRDGSTRVLGGADLGATQQTISVQGPDGRPQQMTFNRRTGHYEPATFGGGMPGQAQGVYIDPSLPPEVRAQIEQAEASGQQVPSQMYFQQPATQAPFVGQSPGEKAAAEAAARRQVELATLPQELNMRTQAAIEQAGGAEAAKIAAERRAERLATLPQTVATADQTIDLLDELIDHPGRVAATGTSSLSPLNRVPGTDAYNFNVLLDQIKGQAFLQAFQSLKGGGAITEREGQAATNAIARLNAAQSEGEFVKALRDLRKVVEDGRTRAIESASGGVAPVQSQAQRQPTPRAERRASNPQTGEVLVLRNGQWVPE